MQAFAYATGSAYGLLLDRYAPVWRSCALQGADPAALLAVALGIKMDDDVSDAEVARGAARYDGAAL